MIELIDLLMQHFLQDVMLFGLISDVYICHWPYIDSETAQPVGVHFNITVQVCSFVC